MINKKPARIPPVLEKLKEGYRVWQQILPHISKSHRQTIGIKIDRLLLKTLSFVFKASYSDKIQKIKLISDSIIQNDLSKFFLTVAWECKIIDDKKYIRISKILVEAGKMLFGWKEFQEKKNPLGIRSFEEKA